MKQPCEMLAARDLSHMSSTASGVLLGVSHVGVQPLCSWHHCTEAPGPRRTAGIRHLSHQHKLNRLIQCGSRPQVYRNILSDRIFSGVLVSGAVKVWRWGTVQYLGLKLASLRIHRVGTAQTRCIHFFSQSRYNILMWRKHPWEIVLAADNNTANARQDPRKTGKQWDLIVERRWRESGNTYPLQGARGWDRFKRKKTLSCICSNSREATESDTQEKKTMPAASLCFDGEIGYQYQPG